MKYGTFDEANREYVIDRPDTPAPWANYLGSTDYGALISNNAGGYSFEKSGAEGRLLRYIFDGHDRPGRYVYLRDRDTGDYWSASWQPVGKPLDTYKSECRHGTAYTIISAEYAGIRSEALYYVPLGREYEVWRVKVTNLGDTPRRLTVTGYAEFTNHPNYEQDQVNLQYSRFITSTQFRGNRVRHLLHGNLDALEEGQEIDHKDVTERFFALSGAPVTGHCGDRERFLGAYRSYGDPAGVELGLDGSDCWGGYGCGALSADLELAPGESKAIAFTLGGKRDREAAAIAARYEDAGAVCDGELTELKGYWHGLLDNFRVKTPSPEFDTMVNTWGAYNCFMTFFWSRAASFVYCGLRNGYGYRDTVQDIQGVIHLAPELAADRLRFMLSAQVHHGGGLPLVKFTHTPGREDTPEDDSYVRETGHPAYRADDALWLFPTVEKVIAETGNMAFLDEVIPFADREEATVYEHLKRAIQFSLDRMGPHGLPAGLWADWNDCLRMGAQGESVFVAMQLHMAMNIMIKYADLRGDADYRFRLRVEREKLRDTIRLVCWDGDRFVRGITESGEVVGAADAPEASFWLNPQSWAVLSDAATPEEARTVMDNVHEKLNTPWGAILMTPPYHAHAFEGAFAVIYNAGTKENAGIFSQTQGWLVLAEARLGHGDRAFEYFLENAPSAQNDRAEVRVLEPYCYGQFTEGRDSRRMGQSHVHWLTGTASTMMVGCVEGILGVRPTETGLMLTPAIPHTWEGFEMTKRFRGMTLHITVRNPDHVESGAKSLTVNGEAIEGNMIPAEKLSDGCEIVLTLG